MKTVEMKITIPKVYGGRCLSTEINNDYILTKFEIEEETEKNEPSCIFETELECRIDPSKFSGEWIDNYKPTTKIQKETMRLYMDAKLKGRLHAFTCMKIDPHVAAGKLVYQKGLPIETGFKEKQWINMLRDFNPIRNSRQMTKTEYACRNLFIIQRLAKFGYGIEESWQMMCDNSIRIGHYVNSDNSQYDFEQTGSRNVCGFYDLGNIVKFVAKDPWDETDGYWIAGGTKDSYSYINPVAYLRCYDDIDFKYFKCVGAIALD